LSSSLIRNIVGQVKSTINIREVMDNKKILILNLSKGRIGEDNSALLGAMMITKIQLAAMSRVEIPERDRQDFYLYIDEFQNFTTESFANILSEARKYRLNLIMAHQYIEQLGEVVQPAIFGNVGTMIVFRVGAADAEELVKEFTPVFTEEDIVNLPKYDFYIKLMIDGIASSPFSGRGLPPLTEEEKTDNTDKVVRVSRERYAKQREIVEEKIMRWHTDDLDREEKTAERPMNQPQAASRPPQPPAKKPEEPKRSDRPQPGFINDRPKLAQKPRTESRPLDSINKYESICSRCGKKTYTSFKPDNLRPIYCKDCLNILRQQKNTEIEERKKAKIAELRKISEDDGGRPGVGLKDLIDRGKILGKIEERPSNAGAAAAPERIAKPAENEIKENQDIIFD
jgi:CxxC-x17-CxxC domain-containing protein